MHDASGEEITKRHFIEKVARIVPKTNGQLGLNLP